MAACTINNFTSSSPSTRVPLNSALIKLFMFTHMGVHETFASSIVYIQRKWGCPLIVAVKRYDCMCVLMHGGTSAQGSVLPSPDQLQSGCDVQFMRTPSHHTDSQRLRNELSFSLCPIFSLSVRSSLWTSFQSQLFYRNTELNCVHTSQ